MNKKDNHPKKICQSIYWNLIKMLDRKENLEPVHILSEFWCTKKCDYIHDMSKLREKTKEYMNKINPDSFERMFQPDWNKEDKDVALRTSIHYNLIYRKELMSGLKKVEWWITILNTKHKQYLQSWVYCLGVFTQGKLFGRIHIQEVI